MAANTFTALLAPPGNEGELGQTSNKEYMSSEDEEFELPELPTIDKGPPPECGICGDPMAFIDGDWCCVDCNGELLGPETG